MENCSSMFDFRQSDDQKYLYEAVWLFERDFLRSFRRIADIPPTIPALSYSNPDIGGNHPLQRRKRPAIIECLPASCRDFRRNSTANFSTILQNYFLFFFDFGKIPNVSLLFDRFFQIGTRHFSLSSDSSFENYFFIFYIIC